MDNTCCGTSAANGSAQARAVWPAQEVGSTADQQNMSECHHDQAGITVTDNPTVYMCCAQTHKPKPTAMSGSSPGRIITTPIARRTDLNSSRQQQVNEIEAQQRGRVSNEAGGERDRQAGKTAHASPRGPEGGQKFF